MAIPVAEEALLSMSQAAAWLQSRGVSVTRSSLYSWASPAGCGGIRLETVQIGRLRHTSKEALQRFFEELSS